MVEVYTVEDTDREIGAILNTIAKLTERVEKLEETPSSSTMLWGASWRNLQLLEQATGVRHATARVYDSALSTDLNTGDIARVTPRVPVYSVKFADWRQAANGAYDETLALACESVKSKLYLIFGHEPENDKKNPAEFVAMIYRLVSVVSQVNNPLVVPCVNYMSSKYRGTFSESADYFLDTNKLSKTVVMSWDGYQRGTEVKTPEDIFNKAYSANVGRDLPFAIAETASDGLTNSKGAWAKNIAKYAADRNAVFCCYWPSNKAGEADYYPANSDMPAFREVALAYGGTPLGS